MRRGTFGHHLATWGQTDAERRLNRLERESTRSVRRAATALAAQEAELRASGFAADPFALELADFARQHRERAERELERRALPSVPPSLNLFDPEA